MSCVSDIQLFTANVVLSSLILSTLKLEAEHSSERSVLTRSAWCLKSYIGTLHQNRPEDRNVGDWKETDVVLSCCGVHHGSLCMSICLHIWYAGFHCRTASYTTRDEESFPEDKAGKVSSWVLNFRIVIFVSIQAKCWLSNQNRQGITRSKSLSMYHFQSFSHVTTNIWPNQLKEHGIIT
jgi:hypothetical protein